MAKLIMPKPAWCFDANNNYALSSNGRLGCSYQYANMNYYTPSTSYPTFILNSWAGCKGYSMLFYVYGKGDTNKFTHLWSMGIPSTLNAMVGLFTYNMNFKTNNGYTVGSNLVWCVDTDKYLKIGTTNINGNYAPPTLFFNTGVDMSPYLYNPEAPSADTYRSHRYAFMHTAENTYDLYVDSTATRLMSIPADLIVDACKYVSNEAYVSAYDFLPLNVRLTPNTAINDIYTTGYNLDSILFGYNTGPGAYIANNTAHNYNAAQQGTIFMADWTGWDYTLNMTEIDAVMTFNYRTKKTAVTSSSSQAFYKCPHLTELTVPGVKRLGYGTIYQCDNLSKLTLSEGSEAISRYFVQYTANLSDIHIPKSVNNISMQSFYRTSNKPSVSLSADCPLYYNIFTNLHAHEINIYQKPLQLIPPSYPIEPMVLPLTYNQLFFSQYYIDLDVTPLANVKVIPERPQVIFDEPVGEYAQATYSVVSTVVKEETDDFIMLEHTSIREPNLKATQRINKVNDGFLYQALASSTSNMYAAALEKDVRIVGHKTNSFSSITPLIANRWYAYTVNNVTSDKNVDITGTCYSSTGTIRHILNTPRILSGFNNAGITINVSNAEFTYWQSSGINCNVQFSNCNAIAYTSSSRIVAVDAVHNHVIRNCNYVFLYGARSNNMEPITCIDCNHVLYNGNNYCTDGINLPVCINCTVYSNLNKPGDTAYTYYKNNPIT